ncbi:IS200/IS605 family element transposase accessory protein TnpB [Leptolyngbya sp. FACHB-321]|uniref:IS200/IS605 family accessory protein TnpB-related protein n=1 Tax=Leptolyngbya sp. FACHB-321 TaxID=2692807 RepID=UPI001682F1B3|nr:IS200/IS605 family accessory protein TnpB-related protein [Leptolyngbya sp. FACHB-321]MBD2033589.1 IS200/IS605 family element transposase accessory protein TnpB [Leptolyngbya sp. FACHB-321]
MPTRKPIIRTDKWSLNPTAVQRLLFDKTVKVYRRLCRHLVSVVFTHWKELGGLSSKNVIPAVERLVHQTVQNPNVKYASIDRVFRKFPSYYRRAAIAFAVGQVSSFVTRYQEWQSGVRGRRDAKPPILTANAGCYPALYRGQCYKLHGHDQIEIKVFTGTDWVWTNVHISGLRERHTVDSNKQLSPSLIFNEQACHLSVPFECHPEKRQPDYNVVAVDLGINTTATVSVVTFDGTVIWREFIHPGRDIDRRDKRLKSVSVRASKTMGKGGRLQKGFCSNTYRKCRNINQQIAHIVSKRIVNIAKQFNAGAIVFEHLKGWKAKGGRKGSNLRQRFHGWLKAMIHDYTELKWQEVGGKTIDVVAAYTSKLAYDGSGVVKRDSKNYALAKFASGKRYNCDLNGSQNIAARGLLKLTCRKDSEEWSGKSSRHSPRSWACLCDLWTRNLQVSTDTTTSREQLV